MPEEVAYREDIQVVQVRSYGDVNSVEMNESLSSVVNLLKRHRDGRVYVNAVDATSFPSVYDLYEFGSKLSQKIITTRIALLITSAIEDAAGFVETVARNRGVDIVIFNSEEAALAWLLE